MVAQDVELAPYLVAPVEEFYSSNRHLNTVEVHGKRLLVLEGKRELWSHAC